MSGYESRAKRRPAALRGYLAIAGAAFFWGASAALGKAVFTGRLVSAPSLQPLGPLILAQTRTSISFLVLAPAILARGGRNALTIRSRDLLGCAVLGVIGVAASNYFYYLAIEKTTVATAIVLQYTAPVWVLVYLVIRGLQRATRQRVAGVAAAVAGCALAIGIGGPAHIRTNALGAASGFLAAFSFAFYNVYGHRILARQERWPIIVYALLGASLFWLVVNPPWRIVAAHYSGAQWTFLGVFAVTSMLVPMSLYFAGLQHLDATRAIVTSCLEPVFAILITALFVGEAVHALQLVGIALVLLATVVVQLPDRGQPQPTDAQLSMAE
jgi:DME family drug/metabolite transporter